MLLSLVGDVGKAPPYLRSCTMLSRTVSGDAMIAILGTPQTLARRNTKARSAAPNHVGARVEPGDRDQH